MEEAPETKSKRFGRVLGKELQGFARLVRPSESSQGSRELGAVGKKYEETTGRDARYDGKVAAIVGLTTAGVVGAGLLIAAASHVVVTGLILAAGTAGVAGCCKLTGHDEEYNQIVNASTTAVHTVVKSTKDFAGGVMEGVHIAPNAAPQGPEGYTRVDSNEAAGPSGNAAAGANNATPPPAAYPTSADGPSPLPPYVNVATPGNTAPLYPPVYAPAPPAAGAKHDLIDLNDSPPKP